MTINDTISIIDTDDTRMYLFRDEVEKREYHIILKDDSKLDRFFPGSTYIFFQPGSGNISLGRTPLYDEPPVSHSNLGDLLKLAPLFAQSAINTTEPIFDRLKIVTGLVEESTPIIPCDIAIFPEDGPEIDMEKPWFRMQILEGQFEGRGTVPGEETVLVLLSRRGYPKLAGPSIEEEARACAEALHSLRETLANGIN